MSLAAVLKHIRSNRYFELVDVARSTGISAARLKEFEDGSREPTFRQFEALANTYGVPSYLLGAEVVPNLPESPTDFRRATPGPARLTPSGMQKIWNAEQVSQASKQLLDATKAPLATWLSKVPSGPPSAERGLALRAFFDHWREGRERQLAFTGKHEQVFLGCFRMFIEAQGAVVRINQAPPDDFYGFYLEVDAGLPTAFVNRKLFSPKAQLFTAVHEYGHLLARASGISDPFSIRNQTERACNQFAAEFLAPSREFSSLVEGASQQTRADIFRLVDFVAANSLLSKHAAAIRLIETGHANQRQLSAWLAVRAKLTPQQLKNEDDDEIENSFGMVHAKLVGEIGYLPTYLASVAFQQKLISSVDIVTSISLSQSIQEKALSLAARRMEVAAA